MTASATSLSYDAGGRGRAPAGALRQQQQRERPTPTGSLPATGSPIATPVLVGLLLIALGLLLTVCGRRCRR